MAALNSGFIVGSLFIKRVWRRSPDAIGERRLDGLAGVEGAEDGDGFDRRAREFRRDVVIDGRKPEDLDVEAAAPRLHRLQLFAADASEAEFEGVPHDRLLDRVRVGGELVADRRADEVGAIGIESFAHQEIDMSEVDEAEVDRDLLAIALSLSQSVNFSRHCRRSYHPIRWYVDGAKESRKRLMRVRRAFFASQVESVLVSSRRLRTGRLMDGPGMTGQAQREKRASETVRQTRDMVAMMNPLLGAAEFVFCATNDAGLAAKAQASSHQRAARRNRRPSPSGRPRSNDPSAAPPLLRRASSLQSRSPSRRLRSA